MQIFILLYIEAGSFIDESDERWEFTVLYVLHETALSSELTSTTGMRSGNEKTILQRRHITSLATPPSISSFSSQTAGVFDSGEPQECICATVEFKDVQPICHNSSLPAARAWM